MKNINVLGIDIAKNNFQCHGVDKRGNVVLREKMSRQKLLAYVANLARCTIAMESCGGSHHLGRRFQAMGHEVKMMAPQFVKPYRQGNKHDRNDAKAVAASQASMRFVGMKSVEQQDIQLLHRVRQRYVKQLTSMSNQIRGMLLEYGIVIRRGLAALKHELIPHVEDGGNELSDFMRGLLREQYEDCLALEKKVKAYDKKIEELFKASDVCQRLGEVKGVGPVIATIAAAGLGDGKAYKNGREFAASLGLVPKEHSSGERHRLGGITKRGDKYLRGLLIHGARSAIAALKRKPSKAQAAERLLRLVKERGYNRAAVALANKNARIIWALVRYQSAYQPSLAWQ